MKRMKILKNQKILMQKVQLKKRLKIQNNLNNFIYFLYFLFNLGMLSKLVDYGRDYTRSNRAILITPGDKDS